MQVSKVASIAAKQRTREWESFHGVPVPLHSDPHEVAHDFIRALHHRLCQPLTAMCCTLEMIQMTREEDKKLMEQLEVVISQSSRMLEMMNAFRQLFEAETPRQGEHSTWLHDVLTEVVSDLALLAEMQGVAIEVALEEPCGVNITQKLLRQALWNAVQNCVELSRKGSAVRIQVGDGRVVLRDGSEPSAQEMTDLFDPFCYCVNREQGNKLSNLPLAVAQRIVIAAGGSLSAGRLDGNGLGRRFELRLPPSDRCAS